MGYSVQDASGGGQMGICEACRLLDGDTRRKLVEFCSLCQAWLCAMCRNSPVRRARAAMKRMVG